MARYKIPNPDRERTERNRELKRLRSKTEPGPERAAQAAALALAFHDERQINAVMELAQLVMADADDGIAVLVGAYLDEVQGAEDTMERLAMLANVARWVEDEALEAAVRDRGVEAATAWCRQVEDEIERMERFEVVERRFDEALRIDVQTALAQG